MSLPRLSVRTLLGQAAGALLVLALVPVLAACGSASSTGDDAADSDGSGLQVAAAFYPLEWVTEQVGGELVSVSNLTPAGVEPHDLELGPGDLASLEDADLVVYLAGFQPAVDDSIDTSDAVGLDVTDAADLAPLGTDGAVDPHFWLDPARLAAVGEAVADELAALDPAHADEFTANARALKTDLSALDTELEDGLADCRSRDLVTSHSAFGYLADRYDLNQVAIAGLRPAQEPSPADLAEVTAFVEENQVKTIYFEALVSPAVAETIAAETGAATAVLDPIEGLTETSAGRDYLAVMRANLATLRTGQPCP